MSEVANIIDWLKRHCLSTAHLCLDSRAIQAGDVFFAMAVFTMKDSWRAGLAENDKTEMISDGIYKFSRNPAFLGFDCVYIGLLLMYVNIPLLLCSVFAMIMLHLQILQEETYLANVFGDEYLGYKSKVCRYLGMHSKNNTN